MIQANASQGMIQGNKTREDKNRQRAKMLFELDPEAYAPNVTLFQQAWGLEFVPGESGILMEATSRKPFWNVFPTANGEIAFYGGEFRLGESFHSRDGGPT